MRSTLVAAHVHSSWSYDAEWSLEEITRAFRRLRYDVVLMAEHDRGFDQERWTEYQRACAYVSTPSLLLIPGIEYADPENVVHTIVWGESIPFLGDGRPTMEVLEAAREFSAATVLAHPWRRDAISRYRPEWLSGLSAVEIWNRKYDGVAPHRGATSFANRVGLAPFVSLDFHTARQFFPLALSVSVRTTPSVLAIVEAIRGHAVCPELLGVSATRLTRGPEGAGLRAMEGLRRRVRGPLRRLHGDTKG